MPIACYMLPRISAVVECARLPYLKELSFGLMDADGLLQVASEELERAGVRTGQSVTAVRSLCPHAVTLPYDRPAYELAAQRVWNALAVETSYVEPVAPEACYVTMSDREAAECADSLVRLLREMMGTQVLAGLGSSKLVALHAAKESAASESATNESVMNESAAKHPGALRVIRAGQEAAFLAPLPISQLRGLSAALCKRIHRFGLHTCGDVQRMPGRELQRVLGREAWRLSRLVRGQDDDPVKPLWPPRSVSAKVEFESDVVSLEVIQKALRRCAHRVVAGLYASRELCRSLRLQITFSDWGRLERAENLPAPVDSEPTLYTAALRLLGRMHTSMNRSIIGVRLEASQLGIASAIQLALLDEHGNGLPHERRRELDAALAYLGTRFGPQSVVMAGARVRARRIDLWTHPLAHLMSEPVQVAAAADGAPLSYRWRGRQYHVRAILDRWCESEAAWDKLTETTIYRVETQPPGLYELRALGSHWRITGAAD